MLIVIWDYLIEGNHILRFVNFSLSFLLISEEIPHIIDLREAFPLQSRPTSLALLNELFGKRIAIKAIFQKIFFISENSTTYWEQIAHGRRDDFSGGEHSSKTLNNLLRKLRKCRILAYFTKRFNKPCVKFLRVWTKNTNFWEIWESFLKIS